MDRYRLGRPQLPTRPLNSRWRMVQRCGGKHGGSSRPTAGRSQAGRGNTGCHPPDGEYPRPVLCFLAPLVAPNRIIVRHGTGGIVVRRVVALRNPDAARQGALCADPCAPPRTQHTGCRGLRCPEDWVGRAVGRVAAQRQGPAPARVGDRYTNTHVDTGLHRCIGTGPNF